MRQRVMLVLLAGALAALGSCARMNDAPRRFEAGEAIPLDQVPAPAKETIQRETQGANLKEINPLREEDKTVYIAEAESGGKTLWFKVAADGRVLDRAVAEDLKLDQLPQEVRAAIERELHDGQVQGLRRATRGQRTYYEAELVVGGKEIDLTLSTGGKVMEKHIVEAK